MILPLVLLPAMVLVQLDPLVIRTSKDRLQLLEAASVPPDMLTDVPPARAVTLAPAPQVVLTFGELATTKALAPDCIGSVNDRLVSAIVLPLAMLMVTRLMPFSPTEVGLNCFVAEMALLTLTPVEATTAVLLERPWSLLTLLAAMVALRRVDRLTTVEVTETWT